LVVAVFVTELFVAPLAVAVFVGFAVADAVGAGRTALAVPAAVGLGVAALGAGEAGVATEAVRSGEAGVVGPPLLNWILRPSLSSLTFAFTPSPNSNSMRVTSLPEALV
jgi:hypothetical protein